MHKEIYSKDFSSYYDALYGERGYRTECDRIENILGRHLPSKAASILDLGCGTGQHAAELVTRGYKVHGIDIDEQMIAKAKERAVEGLSFEVGDMRNYLDKVANFQVVISMFGCLSYILDTKDVMRTFLTANRSLVEGGLFLFDFWNGQAVIRSSRPNGILRELHAGGKTLYKYTEVVPDGPSNNLAELRVTVFDMKEQKVVKDLHRQRFFFMHEISDALKATGFEVLSVEKGNLGTSLTDAEGVDRLPWNLCVVARKVEDCGWLL